jgi:Fur family ferric uptake transcriptional regulator
MGVQRKTKTGEQILAAFGNSKEALSAKMLLSRIEDGVNKTTVYRMLDKLEDDGVVHSFSADGNIKYYARCHSCSDSLHLHSHPHFQCVSCEKVRCLDFEVNLAAPQNMKVTDSQILLKGHCDLCSS